MAEEKQGSAPAEAAPKLGLAVLILTVACWAATIYGLAPEESFLWRPFTWLTPFGPDVVTLKTGETFRGIAVRRRETKENGETVDKIAVIPEGGGVEKVYEVAQCETIEIRHIPVRPMAPVAAVFLFLAGGIAIRKLRGRMAWYKPGQGRVVRMTGLAMVLVLAIFGAEALYSGLRANAYWDRPFFEPARPVLGIHVVFRPAFYPAAAVLLLAMTAAWILSNRSAWGEYQIETEGELRKVSWPPRKEYLGSSMVVLVVTVTMAVFLFAADELLSWLVGKIGGF